MYRRVLLLTCVVFISAARVMGQQSLSVSVSPIGTPGSGTVTTYYGNRNEPPRAMEFEAGTVTVAYFISNINRYFDIPADFTFAETDSNSDALGMNHRLLQQYYKGIPIEGMGYRVHEKDGFVRSANGKSVRDMKPDTQFTLNEQQAFALAAQYLQTKDTTVRQGKKLIVSKGFTFTPESFSVAFQFDISVSLTEQWRISMDARTGKMINKISLVNSCAKEKTPRTNESLGPLPYGTGTGLTRYYGTQTILVEKSGSSSRLVGQTEHGGKIGTYDFRNVSSWAWVLGFYTVYDFYSSTNSFMSAYESPAVSVQWAAEQAYEYYFNKHGRNSFDNKGTPITSYVHFDTNYDNAIWTSNRLIFGDGVNNRTPVELDVVSHEFTHGVTQYEASLQYYNEPGALNESFSDIMGKAVEFHTFGDTATWLMGKYYRDGGLRDFSNPNLKNQPDTYLGNLWYTGSDDSGGVHYNSGVQNFWFYLLCHGGSGVNDRNESYSVNSIGIEAAADITYRNLTEYLNTASDYLDSRIGSLLAATDLYGKNSTTYQEVEKAWTAVGVIEQPIITGLEIYDITATTIKLKGNLIPQSNAVNYHFEYGTTPALGSSSPAYVYTDKVTGVITGLQSATKYYLRLVATNEKGDSYRSAEFTTISLAPMVKIKTTADITEATATLYGQVNPNSLPTSFHFEYGTTTALGLITPSFSLKDTTEYLNVSVPVTNLQRRQTYYYKLVATNGFASVSSEFASFYTAVKPVISSFTPVSAPIDTEITITGGNFNPIKEKNLIYFGATRATMLSSSTTEIKVKVPAGASLGTISVLDTESGLTATSVRDFVPTFTGEFNKNSMQLSMGTSEIGIYIPLVKDMDADGKPDITAGQNQGFYVFQNVNQGGDITLESFVRNTYNIPDLTSVEIFLADMDGNGLDDVIARYSGGLRIYPNFSVPGYIFFASPVDLPIGYFAELAFDDYDQDGRTDIACSNYATGGAIITVIRNKNSKGSLFGEYFVPEYTKTLSYYINAISAADINNDGAMDLLVSSSNNSFLFILKNNSRPGSFDFQTNAYQDLTRGNTVQYDAKDLNEDGWKDITSNSSYGVYNVAIWENETSSTDIDLATPQVILNGYTPSMVRPGDMNGDGKIDLLMATNQRKMMLLRNKGTGGELSATSLENFTEFGMPLETTNSGTVDNRMAIGDLNGDGRPDVITSYYYYFGPHDGYYFEIWQNSSENCLDPSLIRIEASTYTAKIILPPNTTFEDFEIDYAPINYTDWFRAYSTTLNNLATGYPYKVRARAKCRLDFTPYAYINFTTDCVDTNNFSITSTGVDYVSLTAYNLSALEVQYSRTDAAQWEAMPQYASQITNLLPGTSYDLRFRGRCSTPADFKYKQFTTLCPELYTLNVNNPTYNQAQIIWTSQYTGKALLEYSTDNTNWTTIDETGTMSALTPGTLYSVRGRMVCNNSYSSFLYKSFMTPCPIASAVFIDAVTPFSARLNWTDESNTGSYVVTYSTPGGVKTTVETHDTFFDITNLNPGTQYAVSIAPQCVAQNAFNYLTFSTVCYVPFDLAADDITYTTAKLSWDDSFKALPYSFDYAIVGTKAWTTIETPLNSMSLENLRPGTTYEARVHITCTSEVAPYASFFFTTELYQETMYAPNPTDGEVNIYPSKNLIGHPYNLYDDMGRNVATGNLKAYTIDLTDFAPGLYTLQIDGEKTMRLVKH